MFTAWLQHHMTKSTSNYLLDIEFHYHKRKISENWMNPLFVLVVYLLQKLVLKCNFPRIRIQFVTQQHWQWKAEQFVCLCKRCRSAFYKWFIRVLWFSEFTSACLSCVFMPFDPNLINRTSSRYPTKELLFNALEWQRLFFHQWQLFIRYLASH